MASSNTLCFNTNTDRVCLRVIPVSTSGDQIVTQLSVQQVADFIRDNAVPIAVGIGALGLGGAAIAGAAYTADRALDSLGDIGSAAARGLVFGLDFLP